MIESWRNRRKKREEARREKWGEKRWEIERELISFIGESRGKNKEQRERIGNNETYERRKEQIVKKKT